jgi:hypothetical protein
MHRPPPIALAAGLLLVAAVAGRGAEAPPAAGALDRTKTELQQLQRDQKVKSGQEDSKVKLGGAVVDLQIGPDSSSPEAWLAEKMKRERKLSREKEANKNWLLEGMEKLEKEEAQAKSPNALAVKDGAADQSEVKPIDQSDPQYLLKLFDGQKKVSDNKSSVGKSPAAASPDAFAPFMQSWLGSSPVKGQVMEQFARKPDNDGFAGGAPVLPGDYHGPAGGAVGGPPVAGHDAAAATRANPYLADLGSPILSKEVTQEAPVLQSMGAPAMTSDAERGGPVLLPSAPAADNREHPKGPPPSPADDKKYFPQLKRF